MGLLGVGRDVFLIHISAINAFYVVNLVVFCLFLSIFIPLYAFLSLFWCYFTLSGVGSGKFVKNHQISPIYAFLGLFLFIFGHKLYYICVFG